MSETALPSFTLVKYIASLWVRHG